MSRLKDNLQLIILLSVFAVLILLAIGALIAWIVAITKYGNTPITEVPAWAYMFLHGE